MRNDTLSFPRPPEENTPVRPAVPGMELLASARVPGDAGRLRLYRRGEEFSLRIGGTELMNSLVHRSEDALSELACSKLRETPSPVVLIGGLGMGYTLAAALKRLGPGATVVLAELVAEVVEWNRGPLGHLAGHPLDDARVSVREGDVARLLQTEREEYDAVLLDVDNGPEGLVHDANNWLYCEDGLAAAFTALRPGGILAVWSSGPDRGFRMRLRKTGFETEETRIRVETKDCDVRDTVWLARRPAEAGNPARFA